MRELAWLSNHLPNSSLVTEHLLVPSVAEPYSTQVRQQQLRMAERGQQGERKATYLKTTLRFSISLQGYGFFRRETGWVAGGDLGHTASRAAAGGTIAAMRLSCN